MRKIRNQFSVSVFSKIVITITGMISAVLINRALGPAQKGEYAYYLNIINIMGIFLNFGIYHSYPYFVKEKLSDIKQRYTNVIYQQFIFFSTIAAVLGCIFQTRVFLILLVLLPIVTLYNQLLFIALIDSPNKRNVIYTITEVVYTGLVSGLLIFRVSDYSLALIALLVKNVILIIMITVQFDYRPQWSKVLGVKTIQDTWLFTKNGFISMISLFMITLNYRADVLIMGGIVEPAAIGLYSVGVMLAEKSLIICDSFKDVLFSRSSKAGKERNILVIIRVNLIVCAIALVFIILMGKIAITILFGNEFKDAYFVTTIIFIGNFGIVVFKLTYSLFLSSPKRKPVLLMLLGCSLLNIAINMALVPSMGIIGASIASAISYSICGIVFYFYFCSFYELRARDLFIITQTERMYLRKGIGILKATFSRKPHALQ